MNGYKDYPEAYTVVIRELAEEFKNAHTEETDFGDLKARLNDAADKFFSFFQPEKMIVKGFEIEPCEFGGEMTIRILKSRVDHANSMPITFETIVRFG